MDILGIDISKAKFDAALLIGERSRLPTQAVKHSEKS